jgi:hypothetical protein
MREPCPFANARFVLTIGLLGVVACTGPIRPADSAKEVLDRVTSELQSKGYACRDIARASHELPPDMQGGLWDAQPHAVAPVVATPPTVVCEHERTYKVILRYLWESKRLMLQTAFNLKKPCDDEQVALLVKKFDDGYNVAIASCSGSAVMFETTVLLPNRGLDAQDLHDYLVWWSRSLREAAHDSGLVTVMK